MLMLLPKNVQLHNHRQADLIRKAASDKVHETSQGASTFFPVRALVETRTSRRSPEQLTALGFGVANL